MALPHEAEWEAGRKTVQVEVRRRRALARANQAAGDAAGVSRNVAPNQTAASEPVVDSELALRSSADSLGTVEIASGRARHVLKTLSTEEKSARAKALDNAQAADQAARARAEENARRQVEEATRLASEREAADARRSEEEERKKTEEEARRRAEEEAARKLTEKEAKVAVEAAAQGDWVERGQLREPPLLANVEPRGALRKNRNNSYEPALNRDAGPVASQLPKLWRIERTGCAA